MPWPLQTLRFNHSDYIMWAVQTMNFFCETFSNPQFHVFASNIRLRILLSYIFSLCSYLNVIDCFTTMTITNNIIYLFNFQILWEKSKIQTCLDWILTGISFFKSWFYFHVNRILIFNRDINISHHSNIVLPSTPRPS